MLIATTIWVTAAPHMRAGFAVNLHFASAIYAAVGTEELREVKEGFAERCKNSATAVALPKSDSDIDFSNVPCLSGCLTTILELGFAMAIMRKLGDVPLKRPRHKT
jgi:hypothetical protein